LQRNGSLSFFEPPHVKPGSLARAEGQPDVATSGTFFNGLSLLLIQELDLLKEFEKKDVLLKTRSAAKKAEQQEIEVRQKSNPKPTANSPEFDSDYESLTHI
jgi:hypothetical protein